MNCISVSYTHLRCSLLQHGEQRRCRMLEFPPTVLAQDPGYHTEKQRDAFLPERLKNRPGTCAKRVGAEQSAAQVHVQTSWSERDQLQNTERANGGRGERDRLPVRCCHTSDKGKILPEIHQVPQKASTTQVIIVNRSRSFETVLDFWQTVLNLTVI